MGPSGSGKTELLKNACIAVNQAALSDFEKPIGIFVRAGFCVHPFLFTHTFQTIL